MSEKTVKITNGKILNYKIIADNYRTASDTQLVTENTTIEKTLLPLVDEDGIYSLGDRIGDIATFLGYFNATNRDTDEFQRYAVFVLDASYRFISYISIVNYPGSNYGRSPDLPYYITEQEALNATDSATWNTNTVLNNTSTANTFPAFNAARNMASIEINGTTYNSQFPNIYELKKIWENGEALDSYDPTLKNNITFSLKNWDFFSINYCPTCSSTTFSTQGMYGIGRTGNIMKNAPGSGATLNSNFCIIPIFEIPVN